MVWFSLAQSPRSISLQRLLQKGRYWLLFVHCTDFLQFGQATIFVTGCAVLVVEFILSSIEGEVKLDFDTVQNLIAIDGV